MRHTMGYTLLPGEARDPDRPTEDYKLKVAEEEGNGL